MFSVKFLSFHTPADQIWWVRSLLLKRPDCWCSSSSGGTAVHSYAAPLRRTGPPAGQLGHGGLLGTDGPSGPPGNHQWKVGVTYFQSTSCNPSKLKVNLGWEWLSEETSWCSAHTCWSSSSLLQSVHTFRLLMHGSTTVLPRSTT